VDAAGQHDITAP